jgi:hypothetical protein
MRPFSFGSGSARRTTLTSRDSNVDLVKVGNDLSTASHWQKKRRPMALRSSSRSNHHSSSRRVTSAVARVACLAPLPDLLAKLVHESVLLGGAGGREVVEELHLLADDPGDPALHVLRRGEEAHGRPPPIDEQGPPARQETRQELVALVGLLKGVADDDSIDDVGHGATPARAGSERHLEWKDGAVRRKIGLSPQPASISTQSRRWNAARGSGAASRAHGRCAWRRPPGAVDLPLCADPRARESLGP